MQINQEVDLLESLMVLASAKFAQKQLTMEEHNAVVKYLRIVITDISEGRI